MTDALQFPNGIHLLSRWQNREEAARKQLRSIFDATIAGDFDHNFLIPAPDNHINVGGSINLMTLNIMNDLYGMDSSEFYKGDPEKYVRTTLMSRRLLGMNKLYVSWPVYAFTGEAMGQETMYPDKFPPGSDPSHLLITRDNWRAINTPNLNTGIPKIIEKTIRCYEQLTGMEPILHLSAPYSLAADTFGQEPLLAALIHEPGFANELLDHLVDHIHRPWIDHFIAKFPNGWVEMSDASGSPFFIGPQNCKNLAIRAIKRLKNENTWGHRVYDANYRGDYVVQAQPKDRGGRRRIKKSTTADPTSTVSLKELMEEKHSVCQDYVMRLHDDRVPVSFYEEQALNRKVPLFMGIGSSQLDRNTLVDIESERVKLKELSRDYVRAMKNVANHIAANGYDNRIPPWPGTMYFEDVSSESSFALIEPIIETVLEEGSLS